METTKRESKSRLSYNRRGHLDAQNSKHTPATHDTRALMVFCRACNKKVEDCVERRPAMKWGGEPFLEMDDDLRKRITLVHNPAAHGYRRDVFSLSVRLKEDGSFADPEAQS